VDTNHIPVVGYAAVLRAISVDEAIDRTRQAFVDFANGDVVMPPKVYLDSPPHGDFRAMPARGRSLAMLKWVTSFPDAPRSGVPVVSALVCLNDATTGAPLMLLDGRSITALRTGAVAAVAATALARDDARTAAVIGCGVHGSWVARCLVAAGFTEGACVDPDPARAAALADEVGWKTATLADAFRHDIVSCVTPGASPVVTAADLRPGVHLNLLGADGPGKHEANSDALARCQLFCDDWEQASHSGEIATAVASGSVTRDDVTELGGVVAGRAAGRADASAITAFDSTGLAIQDLAIAAAVYDGYRRGEVDAATVDLS
jgi:ornithine cyclodeaminase/alanine dehydrogenase-like protein (mu-crystallin family)